MIDILELNRESWRQDWLNEGSEIMSSNRKHMRANVCIFRFPLVQKNQLVQARNSRNRFPLSSFSRTSKMVP